MQTTVEMALEKLKELSYSGNSTELLFSVFNKLLTISPNARSPFKSRFSLISMWFWSSR